MNDLVESLAPHYIKMLKNKVSVVVLNMKEMLYNLKE